MTVQTVVAHRHGEHCSYPDTWLKSQAMVNSTPMKCLDNVVAHLHGEHCSYPDTWLKSQAIVSSTPMTVQTML